jgi:hypothetical protein
VKHCSQENLYIAKKQELFEAYYQQVPLYTLNILRSEKEQVVKTTEINGLIKLMAISFCCRDKPLSRDVTACNEHNDNT